MTRIRAFGVATVGVAFVRSPRYLAEKYAEAVDARIAEVRDEQRFWRGVVRTYELFPSELPALQARIAAKYCRNLDFWQTLPRLRAIAPVMLLHSGPSIILDCWRQPYSLDSAFDGCILGIREGLTSRDRELYQKLSAAAGCALNECLVVESTLAGFAAALESGAHAYRYGTAYGLRQMLTSLEAMPAQD